MASSDSLKIMDKLDRYAQLVQDRKQCNLCKEKYLDSDLNNPATYSGGKFDSDELGPWTKWQGNLQADILIVGQDWGGTKDLEDYRGCEPSNNPTNKDVAGYLRNLSLNISDPPSSYDTKTIGQFGRHGTVFLTNGILCIKSGDIQAEVKQRWFDTCGPKFLRPTIELVDPLLVISLGAMPARGIQVAFDLPKKPLSQIITAASPTHLTSTIFWLPFYHPSWKTCRFRSREKQASDWGKIPQILAEVKKVRQQLY